MKRIERISAMERCLDTAKEAIEKLSEAMDVYQEAEKNIAKLFSYYGSVQWMQDYEADEQGKLPEDLKRGVLSEDAVYDLIIENRELVLKMMNSATAAVRNRTI